jgi:hypothetical protein
MTPLSPDDSIRAPKLEEMPGWQRQITSPSAILGTAGRKCPTLELESTPVPVYNIRHVLLVLDSIIDLRPGY